MGSSGIGRSATPWVVAALALYATGLVVLAMRQGPGISVDSVYYVHGADSFARSGDVTAFGLPLTLWPVGYPVALGGFLRLGVDPQVVAQFVNGLSVAATVVLTFLLGRAVTSPRAGVVAAAVVALSPSTVRVFSMLWTEPPFTALTLVVLLLLVRAVARRREVGLLTAVSLGALVSLLTMLRYLGVVLAPVVAVVLLWASWRGGMRRALLLASAAGSTSLVGLAVLAVRNVRLGVGPLGDRVEGGLPPTNVAGHTLRALGRYVLPETGGLLPVGVPPSGSVGAILTIVTVVVGMAVLLVLAVGAWSAVVHRNAGLALLALFVLLWCVALGYAAMSSGVDPPNERLLGPVFTPIVILGIEGARRLAARVARRRRSAVTRGSATARRIAVVAAASALLTGTVVGATASISAARQGIGYNELSARSSALGQALKTLPAGVTVAASDPWLAWWVARKDTTTIYDTDLRRKVTDGAVRYLAFFTASTTADHAPAALQAGGVAMLLVSTCADGALYEAVPPGVTG